MSLINKLRPKQNGHHFADDILKCIYLHENAWILITTKLQFIPQGPIKGTDYLTFKLSIIEKCLCFIVLVVFCVMAPSSEMISVWFRENDIFS